MKRKEYPNDLTSGRWRVIRQLLPSRSRRGRPPVDRREVLSVILYVVRTGCHWRQLPHDFPNWKMGYTVLWRWRRAGVWKRVHDALREKVRNAVDEKPTPTAAIIDRQAIRTAEG